MADAGRGEPEDERDRQRRAPGGGEALRLQPSGGGARAVGARRIEQGKGGERARSGDHGGKRQRAGRLAKPVPESRRQRADPEDERQGEDDGAIGADAAVAHDGELALPGRAAAKAVGDVSEPVLVQRAGRGDQRADRQRPADERRQAKRLGRCEHEDAGEPDDRAGDRDGPGDAIEVETRIGRRRQRQAGEEPQRVGEVASERQLGTVHRTHRNIATASTPIDRDARFDEAPLADQGPGRADVGAAQRQNLVVQRRHDEEGVGPARDGDQRAEHVAHVLRLEIGDEAGKRGGEREGQEERHGAAVARPPFGQERLLVEGEPGRLLDPIDIDGRAGEGGGESQRNQTGDHEGSWNGASLA